MWWADLLWGFWNGLTAWIVLIVHVFGGWEQFPFYNEVSSGNWYDFGFLLGAGSPLLEPAAFSRVSLLMNQLPSRLLLKCYKTLAQALPDFRRPVMQSH